MTNLKNEIENYLIDTTNKIKINSQNVQAGDVFIALQGSFTHGNKYINNAFNNGAKHVVTDRKWDKNKSNNILKVQNIYNFLNKVAVKKRNQFNGKIIAITGSIGKTSIKEFLKFFLSSEGIISASIKSYNNYLGVLISLINMDKNSVFSIFEVGTNNFNEIKKLSSLLRPQQVIISNIHPTHLQGFGTTRKIANEKSDLINPKYNPNIELAILPTFNKDEMYLLKLSKKYFINSIITFGHYDKTDYSIKKIEKINNFLSKVTYKTPSKEIQFKTSTSLKYQIINMLITVMIYNYNNLNVKNFLDKTNNIPFIEGRGLFHNIIIKKKKVIFIDESYNASPVSMNNCIDYFENFEIKKDQRKIIIIGEMLELGKLSKKFHREIISKAVKSPIDKIIFSGDIYKQALLKLNIKSRKIFYFDGELKILNFLNSNILKNDIILAKGSNSSQVNKLVKLLLEKKGKKNC